MVGIGADGWAGLTDPARALIGTADVVLGSRRQLDLLPDTVAAQRVEWPSPLRPAVRALVDQHRADLVLWESAERFIATHAQS